MKLWTMTAALLISGVVIPPPRALGFEPHDAQVTAQQAKCPVTPTEDIDPGIFTVYNGTQVYFCCERCKRQFAREPLRYVKTSSLVTNSGEGHSTSDVAHSKEPAEHDDEEPHEHDQPTGFTGWLGRFHPAATDFPIALLLAAVIAELLYMRRRAAHFEAASRFCLWGAALTGIVTALLGWCFGGFHIVDKDTLLLLHRWLGTATALALVAVLVLCERGRTRPDSSRRTFRLALFGTAGLVMGTAFLGGAMVWGLDHYKLWF